MVNYRYLGYGITNEQGIATLDHDSNGDPLTHSYTGTGAGKIDIVASLDDIGDITIVTNPSTITDTGGTYSLSAIVTDGNAAVANESVVFEVRKVSDDSLVDTLVGVTNASGVATVSYSGNNAGSLYIKCNFALLQETYEVTDCYWIEKSSTVTGMYNVSGGTLTLDNGVFTLTKGSGTSYFYLNIPKSSLPISDFVGKDLTVQTDVTTMNATLLRMGLYCYDGSSWSQSVVKDIYDVGLLENTISIPSNSTQVRIRFDIYGNTDDNVVFEQLRFILG